VNAAPGYVTHYYRASRKPFLNLSELGAGELASVLAELATPEQQALSERRFGQRYMALRRATERNLRELFIAAGGEPVRDAPHYFVLGSCAWFAGLYRDVAEVRLPLSALPANVTSLTYADSITAMGFGVPLGLPAPDARYGVRLFGLGDVEHLAAKLGPRGGESHGADGYAGHQFRRVDAYVEVQLWSDEPVRAYLTRRGF
jgi:hypothetical protein